MNDAPILKVISDLYDRKVSTTYEQGHKYNETTNITTRGVNSKLEMYIKYSNEIQEDYQRRYEKLTKLMHSASTDLQTNLAHYPIADIRLLADLRRAKYMFKEDRREYNSEDDHDEKTYVEILKKNEELTALITDETIDFDNGKATYEWVNKLIPYINIQSVSANIEMDTVKYLLNILEEHNYGEYAPVTDEQSFYARLISNYMKELKEYGFFVSEYKNSVSECERLTSEKVKNIALLNYYKELSDDVDKKIGYIDHGLNNNQELRDATLLEYDNNYKELVKQIDEIRTALGETSDLKVTSKIYKTEDSEALEAFEKFKENPSLENIKIMFVLINRLHDTEYKNKLLVNVQRRLDVYRNIGKIDEEVYNLVRHENKELDKERNSELDEKFEKLYAKLEELEYDKDKIISELDEKDYVLKKQKDKYVKTKTRCVDMLSKVSQELKDAGYVDRNGEVKDLDVEDLDKEKESFFDKIKKVFTKPKTKNNDNKVIPIDTEPLREYVAVERITRPKEAFISKINEKETKKAISGGLNSIRENNKGLKDETMVFVAAGVFIGSMLGALTGNKYDQVQREKELANMHPAIPVEQEVNEEPTIKEEIVNNIKIDETNLDDLANKVTEDLDSVIKK